MSLEGFDSVYGQAEGVLEDSIPYALLPFIFNLHPKDGKCLRLQITDFHSNTWQTLKTLEQLEELRDQVGIGGSWSDFLQYFRDAFASDNVKLILGGPASSMGGHGATSARVIAQKLKGMPRVSVSLEKLAGPSAKDAMGNIAVELHKAFRNQSDLLAKEQKVAAGLLQQLEVQKERSERLQQKVDTMTTTGGKRARSGASQVSLSATGASLSQFDAKDGTTQNITGPSVEDSKSKTSGRGVPLRNKVHMAHAKRAKQRGSCLAEADDE